MSVFSFAQIQKTDFRVRIHQITEKGRQAYLEKNKDTLKKIAQELFQIYAVNKDSSVLANHYFQKAMYYHVSYKSDSAFYYYNESKNIYRVLNDSLAVGRRLLTMAVLQKQAKDYLGGEISLIDALRYLEPIESYTFLKSVYNHLGDISDELNQRVEAIQYYQKAIEVNQKVNEDSKRERGYLFIQNNLGLLYQRNNEHKKAINYFNKGLNYKSINVKEKYPLIYALLLENLAASNFLLGNKEEVLSQYLEVLKIREKNKEFKDICMTYINIADYYKDRKEFRKSRAFLDKALQYSKQTHNNKYWLTALKDLSELSSGEESKKYFQEYIQLSDSLLQKERSLKNQFAKIRYETDKKEQENQVLKTENDKKQEEITRQKQQKIIGWLLAVVSFLGLGFTVTLFVFRRRKLLYQAQLQKAQAREQERKQIAKALHDEVAGDLRLLHQKLEKSQLFDEASKLDAVKENVRNLSHQLSSVSFKKVTFKDQIINLVTDYFEPDFKIIVKGLNEHDWSMVNSAVKRLLYICIRESIQNSKRHAQATKVTVTFSIHKKNVLLNITDNGVGFDTTVRKKGIGLHNLQERVEELQGTFSIQSTVGAGTETHIQIPLNV
ncbi:tetratricopeptide repeat-containing sensor histidine kinase [Tenacibaculum sp. TC6]|uniref:tetratricopeptide repeat-containing sensor histidine kinase n=1 Tax=Tenacibaculum sp. TC6 TaxID=3423223 RepID=UPI003D36264F